MEMSGERYLWHLLKCIIYWIDQ